MSSLFLWIFDSLVPEYLLCDLFLFSHMLHACSFLESLGQALKIGKSE